jgi:hypothetical protein
MRASSRPTARTTARATTSTARPTRTRSTGAVATATHGGTRTGTLIASPGHCRDRHVERMSKEPRGSISPAPMRCARCSPGRSTRSRERARPRSAAGGGGRLSATRSERWSRWAAATLRAREEPVARRGIGQVTWIDRSATVPQPDLGPGRNAEGPRIAARPFCFPVEPRGIEPLTSRVRF